MTESVGGVASADVQAEGDDKRIIPFVFTGKAGEFFRIWIVNIVLSILTLGIYSAWAKVRTQRYFYGSTSLDGRSFEYTADPIAILKGRIIAVAVFLVWYVTSTIFPLFMIILFPLLMLAVPWVIVRSLRFRAFNTRYRNLRFHFYGTKWEAAKAYLLFPVLSVFTLGILWPFVSYFRARFTMGNLGFGNRRCSFFGQPEGYYKIWVGLLLYIIGLAALFVLVFAISVMLADPETLDTDDAVSFGQGVVFAVLYTGVVIGVYIFPPAYIKAREGNYLLNHSETAGYLPHSNMKVRELFGIYLTNILAIVFSLGLAIPWTMIRTRRYRLDHLALEVSGELDSIVAGSPDQTSAMGEELGQVFDIDIGF